MAELIRRYPIRSRNVIAHIRKATQGEVALENCHPFVRELWGRYWVFAHNGDLKDFHPRLHGSFHPVGSTDSELAFCVEHDAICRCPDFGQCDTCDGIREDALSDALGGLRALLGDAVCADLTAAVTA